MAYSKDLRERVIRARKNGDTVTVVADRYEIGTATVKRWCRLERETGGVKPRPRGGGMPRSVDDEQLLLLVGIMPDATLPDLTDAYREVASGETTRSSIIRALKRLGLSRKKRQSMQTNGTPTELKNSGKRIGKRSPV